VALLFAEGFEVGGVFASAGGLLVGDEVVAADEVEGQGVAADDEVFNLVLVELLEQLFEVVGNLHRPDVSTHRPRRGVLRAGGPVAKGLSHLVVFIHTIHLDDLAIHAVIIP
jgi:hypothetical protein